MPTRPEAQRSKRLVGVVFALTSAAFIGGGLGVLATAFWISPAFEIAAGVLFALALIPLRRAPRCTYAQLLLASVVGPALIYAVQVATTAALERAFDLSQTDIIVLALEWIGTVAATRFALRHSHDEIADQV